MGPVGGVVHSTSGSLFSSAPSSPPLPRVWWQEERGKQPASPRASPGPWGAHRSQGDEQAGQEGKTQARDPEISPHSADPAGLNPHTPCSPQAVGSLGEMLWARENGGCRAGCCPWRGPQGPPVRFRSTSSCWREEAGRAWARTVPRDRWCANVRLYLLFQMYMVTFRMCTEGVHARWMHPLPAMQASLLLSVHYRKACSFPLFPRVERRAEKPLRPARPLPGWGVLGRWW